MTKKLELNGIRFGKWTVLYQVNTPSGRKSTKNTWWRVKCDCGKEKDVIGTSLRQNQSTSCGCVKKKTTMPGESAKWSLYTSNKINADRRGIVFTLSLEEFLKITGSRCHYCGIQWSSEYPKRQELNGSYKHNGIDRIDSSIGYVSDNCVPCCSICNFAKQRMTVDQFKEWINRAYHHMFNEQFLSIPIVKKRI